MSQAHLYGLDSSGNWVPMRVNATGGVTGGGDGGSGLPAGQPQVVAPWSYAAASGGITDTSDVTLVAAAGVGKSNYLTSLQVCNTSGTATEVVIKSSSTVLWRCKIGASMIQPTSISFLRPLVSANNTALTAACITGATVTYVNAQGYQDATVELLNAGLTAAEEIVDAAGIVITDANSVAITLAA
jgi:hypothetical protein